MSSGQSIYLESICSKWPTIGLAAAMLAALCTTGFAQERPALQVGSTNITGLPDDWSQHRVVYSNPGTEEQAVKGGRYGEWLKTVNDPRYVIHQLKRGLPVQGPHAGDAEWIEARAATNRKSAAVQAAQAALRAEKQSNRVRSKKKRGDIKLDWNEAMGATNATTASAFPAKWSFSTTTASCANDFVVYPTGQLGGDTQASIIAYYNLYDGGCSGTVPLTDWAYNTEGTVVLSPTFSLSGDELAFVQSIGGGSSLVLLRIPLTPPGTGTLGAPVTPNTAASASDFFTGTGCATPCMYMIPLSGGADNIVSSPFYDYASDTLWVGDGAGLLHEFAPVFNGPPTEVTSGWPVQLVNGAGTDTNQVASPVYDSADGNVFVGSTTSASTTTGGFLYSINAATGTIVGASGQLDSTNGIRDAPLLDPSAGMLYVFVGRDATAIHDSGLYQFPTSFTSGSGTEIQFGTGGPQATALQFAGAFDNIYYSSADPSSPTGNLYVCPTVLPPSLFQIPITANVMGTPVAGPQIGASATTRGRCSPMTEFFNSNANSGAGADYLMVSEWNPAAAETGCTTGTTNGCVMSFDVTNPANWSTTLTPLGGFTVSAPNPLAATSGIIVDNSATSLTGAAQMYFLTEDTAGTTPCTGICAVQLSQSAP